MFVTLNLQLNKAEFLLASKFYSAWSKMKNKSSEHKQHVFLRHRSCSNNIIGSCTAGAVLKLTWNWQGQNWGKKNKGATAWSMSFSLPPSFFFFFFCSLGFSQKNADEKHSIPILTFGVWLNSSWKCNQGIKEGRAASFWQLIQLYMQCLLQVTVHWDLTFRPDAAFQCKLKGFVSEMTKLARRWVLWVIK